MFKNVFSYEGRIRRTEYVVGNIFIYICFNVLTLIFNLQNLVDNGIRIFICYIVWWIPLIFFSFPQGAKRCHDIGKPGWWQLIPFFVFWLMFKKGDKGRNKYGDDPKLNKHDISFDKDIHNEEINDIRNVKNKEETVADITIEIEICHNKGTEYLNQKNYALAIVEFTKIIDLDPFYLYNNPYHTKAYNERAKAHLGLENYDMALKDAKKAYDLGEGDLWNKIK